MQPLTADRRESYAGMAMSPDVATGVNIYSKGEDPKLGADSEYPDWLWTLLDAKPTIKQLEEAAKKAGSYEALENDDFFRLVKLDRKRRIKERNFESKK